MKENELAILRLRQLLLVFTSEILWQMAIWRFLIQAETFSGLYFQSFMIKINDQNLDVTNLDIGQV